MRIYLFSTARALALCGLAVIVVAGPSLSARGAQYQNSYKAQEKEQSKDKGSQISEGERQALAKINSAADSVAKLQAAGEFLKKYPKSTKRSEVAVYVSAEIAKLQDNAQRITLAENYLTLFNQPADAQLITPILLDAYIKAGRIDDAFRVAGPYIEQNPTDVGTLTQMALVGTDQIKRNNPKFAQPTQTYAAKAIELIEADKKPTTMDDASWSQYKAKWLAQLYQSLGLISYMSGNKADAKAKIDKAMSLDTADPIVYMLAGSLVDEEYQQLAQQHKTQGAGPLRDETLKQAHAKMDQVIDLFARAVALSEGRPEFQQLHDQLLQNVTTYYKYRHNGSEEGLRQLIDKYKKPQQ